MIAVAATATLLSCQEEKEAKTGKDFGALHISKAMPIPGETIELSYLADSITILESIYQYYVNNKYYTEDLDFKQTEDQWKASIAIPDSATLVAISIKANEKVDNNKGEGFIIPLYNDENKLVKGSKASKGAFYHFNTSNKHFDLKKETDSVLALMDEDFKTDKTLESSFDNIYLRQLKNKDKASYNAYLLERIKYYEEKNELNEKEIAKLALFYEINKQEDKLDSINPIIAKKYPQSLASSELFYKDFMEAKDLDGKSKVVDDYLATMGSHSNLNYTNFFLQSLANAYEKEGDTEKANYYYKKMTPDTYARVLNSKAWALAEKGEELEKAKEMSKKSLALLTTSMNSPKADTYYYYSPKQYKESLSSTYAMYADTYGLINYKLGDLKTAIEYQKKAVEGDQSPEINERYVQFLVADKQFEKAKEQAEIAIKEGKATAKTKEYYHTAYKEVNSNEKDFETTLAGLEDLAKQKMLNDLKSEMINKKSPDFAFNDLEGNKIDLKSLKGKTVVLDFWATWCGPCRASFPGMQTAVTKYKDNPDVAFIFVDTFENGKDRNQSVADFIEKNNYSFHVGIDQHDEESGKYNTANSFGITGIPTKIIIGPDGTWNFTKVGYSGNNDALVKEIDMMIDLSKS